MSPTDPTSPRSDTGKNKTSGAAGTAGAIGAAGAAVAGAQGLLLGDEAAALDGPSDLIAPAIDLTAHQVTPMTDFDDDALASDVDRLLDDDDGLGIDSDFDAAHQDLPDPLMATDEQFAAVEGAHDDFSGDNLEDHSLDDDGLEDLAVDDFG